MQTESPYRQARLARDHRFDGVFFVAVKSTGIFCRPICPAPAPKEVNVEYFQLAQQAVQAGYRPCLRCRPDSAPTSYAWKGVTTTVERGMKLLRQSPELSVTAIAEKLGIGERYFRALFKRHVGIGPKQFQLYDRLLFAKKLLHETDLPIEGVAMAAGFSSARRLQSSMQTKLGLAPSHIRRLSASDTQTMQLSLSFRPPYNWTQIRDFYALRAVKSMEWLTDNSYGRTFTLGQASGWFNAVYDSDAQRFKVEIELDDLSQLNLVVGEIKRVLDLDCQPAVIADSLVASGIAPHQLVSGIRIPGVWSLFEAGCRAVIGQQISVAAAIRLLTHLVQELGRTEQGRRYFPTPQAVYNSDLQFLKIPASRRNTLKLLAQTLSSAQQCSAQQNSQPQDWLNLRGIGPWTVAYAAMRGQSQPDIWLSTDLVIKKQLARFSLNAEQAAPWRSYLTFQLWNMAI